MSIPITGVYVNYLNSFFGNLDAQEQQDLWDQFAQANGYSISNPPPQTLTTQEQFVQFAKGIFDVQQTLALSPDEVKKRDIMFRTFDILLEMLTTLQNTVSVQGKSLIFYGKWQEQYTKMLTRVPVYVGDTSSTQVQPTGPLTVDTMDQLKFGYNTITAKDIAEWWAYNQAQIPLGSALGVDAKTFSIDSTELTPTTKLPTFTLTISVNSTSNPVILFTTRTDASSIGYVITPPVASTSTDAMTRFQENVANFNTAFVDGWNGTIQPTLQNTSIQTTDQLVNVPWQHTYVTPAGSTDQNEQRRGDAESKARGEINARNQQYIENIRSLRDVVQNTSKQVESNLSQTKESITQTSNLLTSILDSLKSLIGSIFR